MVPRLSLKARAVMLLARREHSRSELKAKLLPLAQALESAQPTDIERQAALPEHASAQARVDALLDWLESQGYLSEQRFIDGRIRTRANRYGNLRIRQELAAHGLQPDAQAELQLRESEHLRAQQAWARKFSILPQDASERARQTRFLMNRGFSAEVIHRLLRGGD